LFGRHQTQFSLLFDKYPAGDLDPITRSLGPSWHDRVESVPGPGLPLAISEEIGNFLAESAWPRITSG
jgi:hypothetical protein